MGRSVLAEPAIEEHFQKLSKLQNISVGLILGQPQIQGKDYVVHLARTPREETTDDGETSIRDTASDFSDYLVANHALSVIRMLPAGFYVIGIFVVCPTNLFDDVDASNKIKVWIIDIKNTFSTYSLLSGNSNKVENDEMIVAHYSTTSKLLTCKSFENSNVSKSQPKPVDWKYLDRPTNWNLIESYYELNEIFPVIRRDDKLHMEENFGSSLDSISNQIAHSIIFFDGENLEDDELVDAVVRAKGKKNENEPIQANVYFSCSEDSTESNRKIVKYDGTVHYQGVIGSRIWAHPKNTIKEAREFVKKDIIRSLAARVQIHCDALIENDHIENHIIINEPPRRIFYPIKSSKIQFSDYIFRGEGDDTVIRQAKDILDLDISKLDIISCVETLPEMDEKPITDDATQNQKVTDNKNKKIYIYGVLAAFFVLIMSILLHFMLKK